MVSPAPVRLLADGRLRLDVKFVEGTHMHVRHWGGPVAVVLRDQGVEIPFGRDYRREELDFELRVLAPGDALPMDLLARSAVVSLSADMPETLDLGAAIPAPLVYAVEYTLETRLRIVALERGRSWPRKLWSMLWNLRMEARRRRALRRAAGMQANGYPAFDAYRRLNPAPMLYLDGRMRLDMMASADEMAARAARLRAGGPLRITHSGRLETLKGAQDLLPVARALRRGGVPFTLDIFGAGSLAAEIAAQLPEFDGAVRLHGPVDFESALVPWLRANADVFLSCHRQSDPSCTYLETMGCGVPVLGYDNAMWRRLQQESRCGWRAPMGRPAGLADALARLAGAREEVVEHAARALAFAQQHDCDTEFARRMEHLRARCAAPAAAGS